MKILHLADLHLGKNVLGLSMIEDQKHVLNEAILLCKKENIHHVIISGDVYDRSIPSEEAVSLLNDFLSKAILEEKLKIYIISGNHDSKERLACFSSILEKQGLYIDNSINKDLSMHKHLIEEDGLKVNIYSLPYIFPGEVRLLSEDSEVRDFQKSVEKILSKNIINKEEISIINAHYFVSGVDNVILSDSETKTSVGTIEQVSYQLFDDFDYVALGHLHCPQHIGRETIRYAGSPLRYSVDEISQNKCFTVIDIKNKNDIKIEKHPINPLHEFVALEGSVEELTKDSDIKDERIVFFKLTDSSHVLNAASRLKIKYPRYVGLTYINIKDNEDSSLDLEKGEGFEELTLEEQFSIFFKHIADKELNDVQKDVIDAVIKDLNGRA